MADVYWSLSARRELSLIREYIAADAPDVAVQFVTALAATTRRLAVFPLLGRRVPEFDRDDVRELIFRRYRIVYRIYDDRVVVVSVSEGSRALLRLPAADDWLLT